MLSPSEKGAEGSDNAGVDGDPVLVERKVVDTLYTRVSTNMSIKVSMEGRKLSASVRLPIGTSSLIGAGCIKPSTKSLGNRGTRSKPREGVGGSIATNAQLE